MIHTDFERGFIRAETIAYDDYVTLGGEAGARDAGKLRLEGKEYVRRRRRRDALQVCDVRTRRRCTYILRRACASRRDAR